METYGEKLRARRKELDLSQEALAKRLGLQRQGNLSLYENNRRDLTPEMIMRHARALELKPSELARLAITKVDRIRAGEYDDVQVVNKKRDEKPTPPSAAYSRKKQLVSSFRHAAKDKNHALGARSTPPA